MTSLEKATDAKPLLCVGNRKLGEAIYTFTLPAVRTCPGRSALCEKVCYALKGHLRMVLNRGGYDRRLVAAKRKSFVSRMVAEIRERACKLVRIHVAGDFFSPGYVRKWAAIVAACPDVKFFVYTRSWRLPAIRVELNRMSRLKNLRLWFSCDRDTGLPQKTARRVRLAYMADGDDDVPARVPDLGFRVTRKTVVKRIGGAIVCPVENGTKAKHHTSCETCGICWRQLEETDARRFALPMAS